AGAGVLRIRGPRRRSEDDTEELVDELDEGRRPRGPVLALGAVLAVVVTAGVLHLLFAHGRTITDDGLDAYAPGGGYLGAVPGGVSLLVGRWAALVILLLLGVFAVSLISGRSLRQLAQGTAHVLAPAGRLARSWFNDLFRLGEEVDAADDDEAPEPAVTLYDQDADAPPEPKRSRRKQRAAAAPAV